MMLRDFVIIDNYCFHCSYKLAGAQYNPEDEGGMFLWFLMNCNVLDKRKVLKRIDTASDSCTILTLAYSILIG